MTPITVLLPVRAEDAQGTPFARAVASIVAQTRRPDAVVVVLDHPAGTPSDSVAQSETAVRGHFSDADIPLTLITRTRDTLSASLNRGLAACTTPLVARQDADDISHPERLEAQAKAMSAEPELALVGTWARRVSPTGDVLEHIKPPIAPRTLRWRVLLENPIVHGSVLFNREAVLAVGGYNESMQRSQDHDLWIRLAQVSPIANIPRVLYDHTDGAAHDGARRSKEQAKDSAGALLRAWSALGRADAATLHTCVDPLSRVLSAECDPLDAIDALHEDNAPTLESLLIAMLAMMPTGDRMPPESAARVAQGARVRDVVSEIANAGATELWLWGAGQHTRALLEHACTLALPIAGIVDDAHPNRNAIGGHTVQPPDRIPDGAHVLLSSDWHEEALWNASADARARGVRVWPLYTAHNAPEVHP